MTSFVVPHTPLSAAAARRELVIDLTACEVPQDVVDDAALVMSELVGNAVRHSTAGGDSDAVVLRVTVEQDLLRVELDDCSEHLPGAPEDPGQGAESGRGLLLVAELATSWGADAFAGGKRVWFQVACQPAEQS